MNENRNLKKISLSDIKENFIVNDYQRGYRWKTEDIDRLLNDIYDSGEKKYFLQPIVVKKKSDGMYELIDGQQRLTSIYLVYKVLRSIYGYNDAPVFNIEYKTREETKISLNKINSDKEKSIDSYHIYEAQNRISEWLSAHNESEIDNFYRYFNNAQILWYEALPSENSVELFNRLNIGRIPLTSSELVKATFLGNKEKSDDMKNLQTEIAMQWDEIEKELNVCEFWSFLSNDINSNDKPKIDLILDLVSEKKEDEKKDYYTFFKIEEKRKNGSLDKSWDEILRAFYTLKGWYEDHDCYHKVGYLIASESKSLSDIYKVAINANKDEFKRELDKMIIDSINNRKKKIDIGNLDYNNPGDYNYLFKILLLFNIEAVRKHGIDAEWFPFNKYKGFSKKNIDEEYLDNNEKDDCVKWTMEHIHAQNSDGLIDRLTQHGWLEEHLETVKRIDSNNTDLINDMIAAIANKDLRRDEFIRLSERVIETITMGQKEHISYFNTIANLALLNNQDNAVLSKSTFDVKRRKIKEMEANGKYIPYCTKMVFLKYYNDNSSNQLYYWGIEDMKDYINQINNVLKDYIRDNKIELFSEVDD